ncbi:uncharacterized protein CANTADRAFT_26984 [Suhomyces tanzawaensis NRRL Y-17324]|uniref:Early meiotic induction protein 1 n=1 Tax=Suhomyces tanzawaensis NRRL Y-17324 TaxID=984487 RepID=A0A1E4SF59_9ASCO|nr:uncharacterized protein CANTADRAFT_26984 [Suhomyces tanzawaensis NRRL Y-17324]ODV78032.1 hypothetical protein CANTADRAFT_26984 [Suhomyces tanzawaensis NRRL Y-17324]
MSQKEEEELNQLMDLFKESPEEAKVRKEEFQKAVVQQADLLDFPANMSVVTALDDLFGCFALGGQVKHYYRYGTYASCQKQREKFWFAIKHGEMYEGKQKPLDELTAREINKRVKIQDFYKQRWIEEKAKGLSEDVWSVRKEKLENPFKGSFSKD